MRIFDASLFQIALVLAATTLIAIDGKINSKRISCGVRSRYNDSGSGSNEQYGCCAGC